jgi:hypothetical protein
LPLGSLADERESRDRLACCCLRADRLAFHFTQPLLSVNSALQYGHFAQPVFSIGKNTRGCEFHKYMPGIGQDSGKSALVTVY